MHLNAFHGWSHLISLHLRAPSPSSRPSGIKNVAAQTSLKRNLLNLMHKYSNFEIVSGEVCANKFPIWVIASQCTCVIGSFRARSELFRWRIIHLKCLLSVSGLVSVSPRPERAAFPWELRFPKQGHICCERFRWKWPAITESCGAVRFSDSVNSILYKNKLETIC